MIKVEEGNHDVFGMNADGILRANVLIHITRRGKLYTLVLQQDGEGGVELDEETEDDTLAYRQDYEQDLGDVPIRRLHEHDRTIERAYSKANRAYRRLTRNYRGPRDEE